MRQGPGQSPGKLPSSKQCSSHPKNQECSLVYPQTGNRTNTSRQIDALRQTTSRQATSKKCSNQGYLPAPSPAVQQTNRRPSADCKPIHASSAPATSPPAEQTNKQPPASQHPKASQQAPAPRRRGNRRAHYPAPPRQADTKKGQTLRSDLEEAASYSPTTKCSTIGVNGLNFSVRNG